jgi:hypothetical protein
MMMCECVTLIVTVEHCRDIADCRRYLHQHPKTRLVFLDETYLRVKAAPSHTLTAPGETSFVVVEDNTAYARRYDMIACCISDQPLPPIVFSPEDRKQCNTKGITTDMFVHYIHSILAQALAALDRYPLILIMDKSNIHNINKINEALIEGGCQDVAHIMIMPTQAAKRMSPLDNSLFHTWKERVKQHASLTSHNISQIMSDKWNELSPDLLRSNYEHCLLMHNQNSYDDCPLPHTHQHCNA